jgi:hypothetical protein
VAKKTVRLDRDANGDRVRHPFLASKIQKMVNKGDDAGAGNPVEFRIFTVGGGSPEVYTLQVDDELTNLEVDVTAIELFVPAGTTEHVLVYGTRETGGSFAPPGLVAAGGSSDGGDGGGGGSDDGGGGGLDPSDPSSGPDVFSPG